MIISVEVQKYDSESFHPMGITRSMDARYTLTTHTCRCRLRFGELEFWIMAQ